VPYLSASAVVIHYEEALYQVYAHLSFTFMKLRKSLVKPVTWQKTCNYIELFSSSARDRHARRI